MPRCVECGAPVCDLVKQFGGGNMRLTQCVRSTVACADAPYDPYPPHRPSVTATLTSTLSTSWPSLCSTSSSTGHKHTGTCSSTAVKCFQASRYGALHRCELAAQSFLLDRTAGLADSLLQRGTARLCLMILLVEACKSLRRWSSRCCVALTPGVSRYELHAQFWRRLPGSLSAACA